MIKSKAHKKYYGRKAYADGYYGRIREHAVIEDADGMREEYSLDIGADGMLTAESVVVIEKLNFLSKNEYGNAHTIEQKAFAYFFSFIKLLYLSK